MAAYNVACARCGLPASARTKTESALCGDCHAVEPYAIRRAFTGSGPSIEYRTPPTRPNRSRKRAAA